MRLNISESVRVIAIVYKCRSSRVLKTLKNKDTLEQARDGNKRGITLAIPLIHQIIKNGRLTCGASGAIPHDLKTRYTLIK